MHLRRLHSAVQLLNTNELRRHDRARHSPSEAFLLLAGVLYEQASLPIAAHHNRLLLLGLAETGDPNFASLVLMVFRLLLLLLRQLLLSLTDDLLDGRHGFAHV